MRRPLSVRATSSHVERRHRGRSRDQDVRRRAACRPDARARDSISPIVRKRRRTPAVDNPRTMKTTEIHDDPANRPVGPPEGCAAGSPGCAPASAASAPARRGRGRVRDHRAGPRRADVRRHRVLVGVPRLVGRGRRRPRRRPGRLREGDAGRLRHRRRHRGQPALLDAPEGRAPGALDLQGQLAGLPGQRQQLLVLRRRTASSTRTARPPRSFVQSGGGGWDPRRRSRSAPSRSTRSACT